MIEVYIEGLKRIGFDKDIKDQLAYMEKYPEDKGCHLALRNTDVTIYLKGDSEEELRKTLRLGDPEEFISKKKVEEIIDHWQRQLEETKKDTGFLDIMRRDLGIKKE